jgi:non-specific serine/threonine protein kinase/serine/threonine-protein kinase
MGLSGDPGASPGPPAVTELPERIGPYRIVEKLGEGGMGEVYLAEQEEPIRRRVALKLIKTGMDTRQVVARFESERQALALMNHPNIARVFEAGDTEQGRPYFVMEYVDGSPITEYCDEHRLTTKQRLELVRQVCAGVQHAHQKGIIHRDIKPSNVLVEPDDGTPVPKIIDFGVARATEQQLAERSVFTQLGVLIGTPEYMSPEQAEMTTLDIDTRTDVYSLGVLLYELLVGERPLGLSELRGVAFDEICRRVREDEPSKPSDRVSEPGESSRDSARRRRTDPPSLTRTLRGDLDWITMKALEKDRSRRYASPGELAADIERHLNDEPVLAGRPSAAYRAGKFVRRHRAGVGFAALLSLVLLGSTVLLALQAARIARERDRANEEAATAEQVSEFLVEIFEVSDPSEARGNTVTAREVLDRGVERLEAGLEDQPRVRERLRRTMGRVYRSLGLVEQAASLLERALSEQRAALGDDHLDTLETMHALAAVYWFQDRITEAETLYSELLDARRRVLGADHRSTLHTHVGLANVYTSQERYDEAESLLTIALEGLRRTLGDDDELTRGTMMNLGRVYVRHGKYDRASPLLHEVLEADRRLSGESHPYTLYSMTSLATLYWKQERHDDAERLVREVIEGRGRVLGEDHPMTFESINKLANWLFEIGREAESEKLYGEALALTRSRLDAEDPAEPDTERLYARKAGALADLLADLGRLPEAEALYLEVVEIQRRILGEDHQHTLRTSRSLAELQAGPG